MLTERKKLLILFLVALAFRMAFVMARNPTSPAVDWADDQAYDSIANTLATQHKYENPWYPPGYPLFLASIYAMAGRSPLAARVVNVLLGSLSCVLLYRIGKRVFSQRVGLFAAGLLALYPGHAYMSWHIMAETLYILLLLAAVWQALRLVENPNVRGGFLLGLTVGCFHLVKSNLFPFSPLLMVWVAFASRGTGRQRALSLVALVVGFSVLAFITPIANSLSPSRHAAALPANAGNTFWTANNPLANGYFIHAEFYPAGQAFIEKHGFKDSLEKADVFEQSRIYRTLGLLWIREHPVDFLILCLQKLNNAFGLSPHSTVFSRHPLVARFAHMLTYGWIALLALAGMVAARRRWRDCLLLYLVVLSYVLMVLIFYGTMRFTLVVIPFLMLFASYAIMNLFERKPASGNQIDLGVARISQVTRQEGLALVKSAVRDGDRHYICFFEGNLMSNALREPNLTRVLNGATAVFPDGAAVMMLAQLRGYRLTERLPGPSFLLLACEYGVSYGWRHFFYGGAPGVTEKLAANLRQRFPQMKVAGTYSPPFRELTETEEADVARMVRGADLMWVALGSPKQERWVAEHCGKLDVPVMLAVGAAFDFHSGERFWAPAWVRRIGMEWAFRMFTGGGKIFRRNVRCVSVVAWHLTKEVARRLIGVQ